MSTALQLCDSAFRQANLDQTLTSFSTAQEFPYNCALDLLNTVIQDMNRRGRYWFTETSSALTYSNGVYQYNLTTLGVDPNDVTRVRREATDYWGELNQLNWPAFQQRFRRAAMLTELPRWWSKYNNSLELNTIPDQDYSLRVYYFRDMPAITATTDTLLVPEADEDVVREGIYAYLLQRLARPDFTTAYQLYIDKVSKLLAEQKRDRGIARQFPAAF